VKRSFDLGLGKEMKVWTLEECAKTRTVTSIAKMKQQIVIKTVAFIGFTKQAIVLQVMSVV